MELAKKESVLINGCSNKRNNIYSKRNDTQRVISRLNLKRGNKLVFVSSFPVYCQAYSSGGNYPPADVNRAVYSEGLKRGAQRFQGRNLNRQCANRDKQVENYSFSLEWCWMGRFMRACKVTGWRLTLGKEIKTTCLYVVGIWAHMIG